ncbi:MULTISPECIES: hypothetical protein, partial [unclassified Delftia]|uniref:hypothetical protein n=1 Tax=unclassified Delftia TaxID=2613839 RepID=UPI001F1F58DA
APKRQASELQSSEAFSFQAPAQARTEAVAMVQALGNGYFSIFSWFSVSVQKARYNSKLGGCSSAG